MKNETILDVLEDMDKWVEVIRRFNGDSATLSEFIKRLRLAHARKPESAAFEKEMLMYKTLLSKLLEYAFPQCANCEDVCDTCEKVRNAKLCNIIALSKMNLAGANIDINNYSL